MKQCMTCLEEKPICAFPKDRDGHRNTCKACHSNRNTVAMEHAKNRAFNRLIQRAFLVLLVTGIFAYDYVDGRNRMCFYKSVYGTHVVTIDSMSMCPLTWEFDE